MKKLLLSLAAMALSMSAMAVETSYTIEFKEDASSQNMGVSISNQTELSAIVSSGSEFLAGVATTPAPSQAYGACNYGLKIGANKQAGVVAFNVAADYQVVPTKVEIQYSASKNASYQKLTFNDKACPDLTSTQTNGTYATATFTDITEPLTVLKFNKTNASTTSSQQGFIFVKKITVTYEQSGEGPKVAAPTFELVKSEWGYNVEISCATEGAEIYYTTSYDETAPAVPTKESTRYSGAIDVWGMTSFKAIAYVGDEASNVASYTANPPMVIEDFSNLVGAELEAGQEVLVEYRGNATVVYQNGNYLYVVDGTGTGMCLYGKSNGTYNNGDVITGITGTYVVYLGLPEIKSYTIGEVTTGGAAVEPVEIELFEVQNNLVNKYVKVPGVTIAEGADAKSFKMTNADGDEVALYNQFGITVPTGENFTVTGMVGNHNGVQLLPVKIEGGDVMETVATPVIEPASGELEANDEITITCATEGATIYYTVDGTVPTAESTEYTAPIVFTEAMTLKAIAVKEGMMDSEVAEAVYTLYNPNVPVSAVAQFDFTTFDGITVNPAVTMPTDVSSGADLETGSTLTKDNVTISIDNGQATKARIWKTTKGDYQFRPYNGSTITFTCPSEYCISKIEYTIAKGAMALAADQAGTYADKVWTAGDAKISEVKFDCISNAQIDGITVTLEKSTGVEGVEVEEDAAPVYYNLQGVRVNNPERGIYIQVKGNKATKVAF